MRALVCLSMIVSIAATATAASAQQVTRMPDGAKNAVGIEGGFESAFIARATYTRRIELGPIRDARLFGGFTLPVIAPDLSDWAINGGFQATPWAYGNMRLALAGGPVVRNTANSLFSATAVGISAAALFGYESPRWGLSAEIRHEQMFATHLRHAAIYRDITYPGAKDGWYSLTGSTTQAGLRGGVRVGAVEVAARVGYAATGYIRPAMAPFFVTLGVSYAF